MGTVHCTTVLLFRNNRTVNSYEVIAKLPNAGAVIVLVRMCMQYEIDMNYYY